MIKIKESKAFKICLHFLSEPRRLYVQMLGLQLIVFIWLNNLIKSFVEIRKIEFEKARKEGHKHCLAFWIQSSPKNN